MLLLKLQQIQFGKKIIFFLVFLSLLVLGSCSTNTDTNNSISNDNARAPISENEKEKLSLMKIDSTFPEEEIEKFKDEVLQLEKTDLSKFDNMKRLARLYKYLGYSGKGIILYEDYLANNPGTDVIYNNLGNMYNEICKVDNQINIDYCNKAIEQYQLIIDKYHKVIYYKYITSVYIKMDNIQKAQETYNLYLEKGGKTDSIIEKDLGLN